MAQDSPVLDIGTGTGFLAIMAAELRFSVTAIDFAEQMLDIARKKTAANANNLKDIDLLKTFIIIIILFKTKRFKLKYYSGKDNNTLQTS